MPSIAQLEKQINELEAKRLLKVDEYTKINALVEKKKIQVLELETRLREQDSALMVKPAEIQREIERLEEEKERLDKLLLEKKGEIEIAASNLSDLKAAGIRELTVLDEQKKVLQRVVKDATGAVKDLNRDIEALKSIQAKEQANLGKLKDKYGPLLEDLQKQVKAEGKNLLKIQKETGELMQIKPKLDLYYRRIKRYYKQAGLEWFEIKDLE